MTDLADDASNVQPLAPGGVARQLQDLTDALAARDNFIGLIGHELRNAVAPMLLLGEQFAAMAGEAGAPAALASRAQMFHRGLGKLMTAIDRVTEVADLRAGKLRFEVQMVDLVDVVAEVCRDAQREAAAGGTELVFAGGSSVIGTWDRGRVKQIVGNLVSNAIRYGGGGAVELSVIDHGATGVLVVRDHGPGLDPAALARLFAPFDALGAPFHERARRAGGFGIGLWVVKTLCTAMQGSVTAENCASGGARFCVALPRG